MGRKFSVVAEFFARDAGASQTINKVEGRFRGLAGFLKGAGFLGVLAAVTKGFREITQTITTSIDASAKQELAAKRLTNALSPLGDKADEVSKALQRQASALQSQTAFGDEAILEAQSLIASFTREQEQIEALTRATLDLASAKGIDLTSAADLIAKSFGSSTNALSRYGIEVEGAAGSTKRLETLTENLSSLYGGRAAADAKTYAGAIQAVANAQGDAAEKLGDTITKSAEVAEALRREKEAYEELGAAIESSGTFLGRFNATVTNVKANTVEEVAAVIRLGEAFFRLVAGADEAAESVLELSIAETKQAAALDLVTRANERAARIEKELQAVREASADALEKLGIATRSDLLESLAKVAEQERQLFELERQGEITRNQLTTATKALAVEQAALQAVLDGEVSSVEAYKEALESSVEATRELATTAATTASAVEGSFAGMAATVRSELEELATFSSKTFDQIAASAGRAQATTAALRAGGSLTLGGTRVNLPGGGSRLVREPGSNTGFGSSRSSVPQPLNRSQPLDRPGPLD